MRRSRTFLIFAVGIMMLIGTAALAAVGQARTEGPNYDRNPTLVQDGDLTYMFFARSKNPCDRLAGCNADQQLYDMYVKSSANGGKDFGPSTFVAPNPTVLPTTPHFGRTLAATRRADGTVFVFWASGGNQSQLYYVQETAPGVFSNPAVPVIGPGLGDVFNVEAVSVGNTIYLYTEEREPDNSGVYGIYARTFDGTAVTAGPNLVAADKHIPKAIVDRNGGFRMTMVYASQYPTVDIYVDSSADGITWLAPEVLVLSRPGESNWDPTLTQKPNGQYYLHFAPDREEGAGRQQIALMKSNDFVRWHAPHDITPGFTSGIEYWDYWPEGFVYGNQLKLFYTSERATGAATPGTGHIWSNPGQNGGDVEG